MSGVFLNIPILNEVENIRVLIDKLEKNLNTENYTILFVDDGSTDGTIEVLDEYKSSPHIRVLNRRKSGRGCQRGGALVAGMHWGLANTNHTVFVEMDGDLSHRPEELYTGIKLAERPDVDFVIGSKYLPSSSQVDREMTRETVSWLYNFAVRLMINRVVTDYSNGLRFYSRGVAETLSRHSFKYTTPIYLSEALAIVLAEGFRIAEYPSTYIGRAEGQSKVRMSDFLEGLLALTQISYRYHRGRLVARPMHVPVADTAEL